MSSDLMHSDEISGLKQTTVNLPMVNIGTTINIDLLVSLLVKS